MNLETSARDARKQLCADVCRVAGDACADAAPGAAYEGDPLAPSSVPCMAADAGIADAGRGNRDAEIADADVGDASVVGPNVVQRPITAEAQGYTSWKTLRTIAEVKSGGAPTPQACISLCYDAKNSYAAGTPTCTQAPGISAPTLVCKFPGGTEYGDCGGAGRAPSGLMPPAVPESGSALAKYWLTMQYLEAASVPAFCDLAEELAAHGAPRDLVRRAERAAKDEVRHAAAAARELAAHGLAPAPVRRGAMERRGLLELAQDNAREGCVRESFAALLAHHQARAAASDRLRRLFARIARDEADHAELAWDVHAWATTRLDVRQRAEVAATLDGAAAELRREHAALGLRHEPALAEVGLDDAAQRARLAFAFTDAVRATC